MGLSECKIVNVQKITDARGSLGIIEEFKDIPFAIKRVYYLYDVPTDHSRGGHAHKELEEFIFAGNGSFDVILGDGKIKKRYRLDRPDSGLYVSTMTWLELENFSPGAVCIAIASDIYKEDDYIRDYKTFLKSIK